MSTYSIPLASPVGTNIFVDTASTATGVSIKGSAGTVFTLDVDNTATTSVTVFSKLYDKATAASVGTDPPDIQMRIKSGKRLAMSYGAQGCAFTLGISSATTTAGGTTSTAAPTHSVILRLHY